MYIYTAKVYGFFTAVVIIVITFAKIVGTVSGID